MEIIEYRNGAYKRIALLELQPDGKVAVSGEPSMVAELAEGIPMSLTRQRLLPTDGEAFLSAVIEYYKTPYLFARYVK